MDPRQSADSPKIFENALLEKLSRAHPRLPVVMYGPLMLLLLFLALTSGPALAALAAALAGYVCWTLTEYFGHRYIFHLVLPGAFGARLHFLIHGIHHEYPNDPWRLVMPPLMSLPVLGLAALLVDAIFGPALFAPAMAGYLAGYIVYDTMHYELHHRDQKTAAGRWLKRMHMLHHFRDDTRGFGISCPWLDYCFGTAMSERAGHG